jgi:hypothetical protein
MSDMNSVLHCESETILLMLSRSAAASGLDFVLCLVLQRGDLDAYNTSLMQRPALVSPGWRFWNFESKTNSSMHKLAKRTVSSLQIDRTSNLSWRKHADLTDSAAANNDPCNKLVGG